MTGAGSADQGLWPRVKGNSGIQVGGEGKTEMWSGALLVILFVTLHSGNSATLPFSRRLCMLAGFLVEIFTGFLLVSCGQCVLILSYLLDSVF